MKEIINTNAKNKNITLTQEQYEKLTQSAILQNIVDDLKIDSLLNGIQYENEVKMVLQPRCISCTMFSKLIHTVLQYKSGLSNYCVGYCRFAHLKYITSKCILVSSII